MKHLFVIDGNGRDYHTDRDIRLSDSDCKQMEVLGKAIKEILNGSSAYIISSIAPAALKSSEILAAQLAIPPEVEKIPYLWASGYGPRDSYFWHKNDDRLMGMVNERRGNADGLIIVTHLEVVKEFPKYFLKEEFGQSENISIGEVTKDPYETKAIHIDLERRTHQDISIQFIP